MNCLTFKSGAGRRVILAVLIAAALALGVSGFARADSAFSDYVYATANGTYYHSNATCSGMRNAHMVTASEARFAGKTACPICHPVSVGALGDHGLPAAVYGCVSAAAAVGIVFARRRIRSCRCE